jgi:hypothetical protein
MNQTNDVRTDNSLAIARAGTYEGLTMACAPTEAKKRLQELQAFVVSNMQKNVDYGVIPGTDKPSLYQPGAQKLSEIYGFGHRFVPVEQVKDWDRGFFYFEYKCILFSRRDGLDLAEGIGSCNSKESKYGERWVFSSDVPAGIDKGTLKTRKGKSKKPPYADYTLFQIPNPDPYSLVNTLQKMAAKRAYIHAVIAATRSSGILTQDVEDLPPDAFGMAEDGRSWEHDPEPSDQTEAHTPSAPVGGKTSLEEKLKAQPQAEAGKPRARDFQAEADSIKEALANAKGPDAIKTIRTRYQELNRAWPSALVKDVQAFYALVTGKVEKPAEREPGQEG